jgi:arylformamidase
MPNYESEYNNRARVPEHPEIMAGWARDAAAYRSVASCELGVRYGATERQFYDLFRPAEMKADALAVFIHGGYWRSLEPSQFSHMARGANAHGAAVAVIGYDLLPNVAIADIIGECRYACATLYRRFGLPITVYGHSAGGHLAACMVATDWRAVAEDLPENLVRSGYGVSGIYNLKPLTETSVNAELKLGLEESELYSPFFWPAPSRLSFDAVAGADESDEFLKQSRRIVDVWGLEGVVTRYGEAPGNHFTVINPFADPDSAMSRRVAELAGAR